MHRYIRRITNSFVEKGIINETNAAWFQYGIERRIATLCVGIPFFLLAVMLTNLVTALTYYLSFFILRTKTNGYHAKTMGGCIIFSLTIELLLCVSLYPVVNFCLLLFLCVASCVVTWRLAPYLHENLPLTNDMIVLFRKQARQRSLILLIIALITHVSGITAISNGITMGITMASGMLCFPYIKTSHKY